MRLVLSYGTRCQWKVIIIIRDELGFNTPVWALSDRLFTGLPSCLRPYGLYFNITFDKLLFILVPFCLICVFLDSCQLVLLSSVPKFLNSFCGKKGVPCCSYENFNLCHWRVPVPNTSPARRFGAGTTIIMGHVVVQLIRALRYKVEGLGFNSQWGHWDFLLT